MITDFNAELDLVNTIYFNYNALLNGMTLAGVTDGDLRQMISRHCSSTFGFEQLDSMSDADQYKSFIKTTRYAFALEGFEGIFDWSIKAQACFIAFFPGGFYIWCLALAESIFKQSKAIEEARAELKAEGFYNPGANPNDFHGTEEFTEKSLNKYKAASVKAYQAKILLEKLDASYSLLRIFTDAVSNNSQLRPRQFIPSIKKLGYIVDEQHGKLRKDSSKEVVKGTMASLGYGDPNFIKQVFTKTSMHTEILPEFIKAMKFIQEEQKNKDSVKSKLMQFFKVSNVEAASKQDKIAALLISNALRTTLIETEHLFKMSLNLMSVVKKYDK
jgi:hypothetical protein